MIASHELPPQGRRQSIDINAESDVSYWTHTLGISELELRKAVAEVGPDVNAVQGLIALNAPLAPPVV